MYPANIHVAAADPWEQPNWYALFVRSNQEKRVAARLEFRGVEHFLPCYLSERQWKDRRVQLERPLFPGYVFVRLAPRDRMHVLTVPNVVNLVGTRSEPSIIPEEEITWIREGVTQGCAEPHPVVDTGARVVVVRGTLEGLQGTLLRAQNGARVLVSIDSIAQAFVVNIDLGDIRYLASPN